MPPNPILICARSPELRAELEAALVGAGYATRAVTTPADAVAAMRGKAPDLIVAEGLAASGAIASLRTSGAAGVTPILVVAPARDVEARIAFLEAGADDVIDGGFDRGELEGRVMALLIRSGKVRPELAARAASGEIITFFSPKGGVGTTTLAVNTAVLLAGGGAPPPSSANGAGPSIPASRVLLIDLDLQFRPLGPSRTSPAGGRLPRHARASPADRRADAAAVRSHHRRPRQPPRSAIAVAARAGRCPPVRPLPGDRRAPGDEPAHGIPCRHHPAAGQDAPRRQPHLPQGAAEDPRRREPAAREAGGGGAVHRGRHDPLGERGRAARHRPPGIAGRRVDAARRPGGHRHLAPDAGRQAPGAPEALRAALA